MAGKRIHRKTERTPEEQARLRAVRDWFDRERPSPDDLAASGDYDPPVPLREYVAARLAAKKNGK